MEERVVAHSALFARHLLADGEVVILELKPSLWFIPLVSAPMAGLGVILLLAAEMTLVTRAFPEMNPWLRYSGGWLIALRLLWGVLQWACRLYVLTDRRVIRQKGVLTVSVFECRLDKLQNTFIQRTVVQRILGIGNIYFATAGTGAVEAAWQHVRRPGEVHREIVNAATRFQRISKGSAL